MKNTLLIVIAILAINSANASVVTGMVTDTINTPVEFATVVLLQDSVQVAGGVTEMDGRFKLETSAKGGAELVITYIGYETYSKDITISGDIDLGDLVLKSSSVMMQEVEVKASHIIREADRYTMVVENMPTVIGDSAEDLLKKAPGIWVSDDGITINGMSGSTVYVNDKEMKMSTEELILYLNSLSAEDIATVEVIPIAGAEFSADSQGGIIKITLKRNRDNGLMGSVGVSMGIGEDYSYYSPRANLYYMKGKLNMNAAISGSVSPSSVYKQSYETEYFASNIYSSSSTVQESKYGYGRAVLGAVYDLNKNNSIGAEFEVNIRGSNNMMNSNTELISSDITTLTEGEFNQNSDSHKVNAKLNYISKIDTIGSTLKVLANYIKSSSDNSADNNLLSAVSGAVATDSVYRDNSFSDYEMLNIGVDLFKKLNNKWSLTAGGKYSLNGMDAAANYEYQKEATWLPSSGYDYDVQYKENIAALYATGSLNIDRWSIKGGLRGEYTYTTGRGDYPQQSYFDYFPNANIMYALTEKRDYSVTVGYARYISRPSFWALSPTRRQISENTYQVGNPSLTPSYANSISLHWLFAYKYSLYLGTRISTDEYNQLFTTNTDNPEDIYITFANIGHTINYVASANAPIQFTPWWSMNANLTYMLHSEQMDSDEDITYSNMFYANCSMNFTLPKDFYIELKSYANSAINITNVSISPFYCVDINIKKTFADKKWTASLGSSNLIASERDFASITDEYSTKMISKNRMGIKASITYNFNSGKKFSSRKVEGDADDSRLSEGVN
ncbi:MAG: outer membrane beta-barrel family protein [Bacteroidales bacterium]